MGLEKLFKKYPLEEIKKMSRRDVFLLNSAYDEMAFLGEIKGTNFITYEKLIADIIQERYCYTGIPLELGKDTKTGGNWLKFMDFKYRRNGKPRTFYISKKPVTNDLSKSDIFNMGCLYGLDILKDNGDIDPRSKVADYYKPKFFEINNQRFIARLLHGAGNFGECINKQDKLDYGKINTSEWYRTILPVTRAYRFGVTTFNLDEHQNLDLSQGRGESMKKRVYNIELAQYDWFKDLNLGPERIRDGRTVSKGQYNWVQENLMYSPKGSAALVFGSGILEEGATSISGAPDILKESRFGFRPVLELID